MRMHYVASILLLSAASTWQTALPENDADAETVEYVRVGRRERCRQTMQEMKKYQDVVRRLNTRVTSLERDLRKVYDDKASQQVVIGKLRGNLSDQERMLNKIVQESQRSEELRLSTPLSYPRDCDQVYQTGGIKYAGDYLILIQPSANGSIFKVVCDAAENSGWIIIQRRTDGAMSFNRGWEEYKDGFGDLTREFWLGNDKISQISSHGRYMLRIEMEDLEGRSYWAEYSDFRLENETQRYRVHVKDYRGDAGDSLLSHRSSVDGAKFSTYDKDNDGKFFENCADIFMGGWWYNDCRSHLNGEYAPTELQNSVFMTHGVVWSTSHQRRALKSVRMMIRPNFSPEEPGVTDVRVMGSLA